MSARSAPAATCTTCGSDDVLAIVHRLGEVTVTFSACRHCSDRYWERDGARVPLKRVLTLIPKA